jgi:hypothetical protein
MVDTSGANGLNARRGDVLRVPIVNIPVRLPLVLTTATAVLVVVAGALGGNPKNQFFLVQVQNDTGQTVAITECSNDACTELHDDVQTVGSSRAAELVASDRGVPQWWAVQRASDPVYGCIRLEFRRAEQDFTLKLSEVLSACPERDETY